MPFAEYTDFADCVAQNQDAADPEAYCAEIKRSVEGKSADGILMTRDEVRKLCPSCADKMEAKGLVAIRVPVSATIKTASVVMTERDEAWLAYLRASDSAMKRAFTVAKLDEAQRLVFGWASVAVKDGDTPLVDRQGDMISPAELEKAAYDFVEHSRITNEMHQGDPVGVLVESLMVTPEKLEAMGLMRKFAPKHAMWVGFRVSPQVFAKVKAGELSMFSIEGSALKVAA